MLKRMKKILAISLVLALFIPASIFTSEIEAAGKVVYNETFETGQGKATQSGGAKLTQVKDKKFEGNDDGVALYVSGRANDWDAVDFKFDAIGLENGKNYLVEASIFVDANATVPAGAQAALLTVNSYGNWAASNYVAGKAVKLSKEFTVDTSKDQALRIQSNAEGKSVSYYIGNITFTEVGGEEPNQATSSLKEVYKETFASGAGKATASGGAKLSAVTNKKFEGNDDGAALSVTGRANDWDAVDFKFADLGLQNGKKYIIEAQVYVDETVKVPTGAEAAFLTVNSYGNWASVAYVPGKAVKLEKEFTVDTSKDEALRIQSNADGKTIPFYIGGVTVSEVVSKDEADDNREPAIPFTTITFEDSQTGGFTGRAGTEKLTIVSEANHTENGSKALKIEGRDATWQGPSLRVEKFVDKGYEYNVTAWVKLIAPSSSQIQLSTQVGNGGSANYVSLSSKTISTSDGWVLFEGNYRYNSVGDEYLTIYVESASNATASFYIDDITFTKTSAGKVEIQKDITPVKEAYKNDFLIGNAISAEDLEGNRLDLLKMHHNVQTTGNAMKPDALQPTKGNFTFDGADKIVNKVLEEGMQMHGHVLVWHQQSPDWMNTKLESGKKVALSRDEALTNLRTHIKTVVEHFGDRVISWDVVNEGMIDNPPNPSDWEASLRKSQWYEAIGPDYIEQAFLAAREVLDEHPEWDIKLYYNDYNEDHQGKATAIYNMVKEINERYAKKNPGKLLIDGVGMQGHYNINTNPENVRLSLERFISLGTEVSITELDIQAGTNFELSDKLAAQQAYLYAKLFDLFKEHKDNIVRVTFWGLDDNTSWRASSNPLIFDKNLQAKPSYYAVINPEKYIAENQPEFAEANKAQAAFGTPKIDGKVDDIWSKTEQLPINRYQLAWQGASGVAKALWDNNYLYVLVEVSDGQLNKANANPWEQDSIEVFLDQNNEKTTFYQEDDGQYRVNFENITSFNPTEPKGFQSAVSVNGTNYTVEVKIPLTAIKPSANKTIGFDIQINDAKDGTRQSAATWNDTAGTGYMDTSVFGLLTLVNEVSSSANQASWADYAIKGMESRGAVLEIKSNDTLTREQFIDLLVKGFQFRVEEKSENQFSDVKLDSPFADSILVAKQLGIISGDKFNPTEAVTREQMSSLLVKAIEVHGKALTNSSDLKQFIDTKSISVNSLDDVKKLVGAGLLVGKETNKIAPKDKLTYGEAAVVLYRVIFN